MSRSESSAVPAASLVVDPQLPPDAKQALSRTLSLYPFRAKAPQPETRYQLVEARVRPDETAVDVSTSFVAWTGLLILTIGGLTAAWLMGPIPATVEACIGALLLVMSVAGALTARRGTVAKVRRPAPVSEPVSFLPEWHEANAGILYHRRYVRPDIDMDNTARPLWDRAGAAAYRISRAQVMRQQRLDCMQIGAALPEQLWRIGDRLARLTELRASQQEIFRKIEPDDPDVAAIVERQRHAQKLASADVAKRVQSLEAFADLVDQADQASRKAEAVQELADLNPGHVDLVAGMGENAADESLAESMANDALAIIEQAREVIRKANEAARDLALPDEDMRANGT